MFAIIRDGHMKIEIKNSNLKGILTPQVLKHNHKGEESDSNDREECIKSYSWTRIRERVKSERIKSV